MKFSMMREYLLEGSWKGLKCGSLDRRGADVVEYLRNYLVAFHR